MNTPARLITIPISHYCEKARWALTYTGVAFIEDAHLQVFHYFAAKRAGGGRTVPVLVHTGGVLADSTDILRWAHTQAPPGRGLFPDDPTERAEVVQLEEQLDATLGPPGRLWMYHHMLSEAPELAGRYGLTGVPSWQRAMFRPAFPIMKRMLRRRFRITPAVAAASLEECHRVFDNVAARIADGRKHLVGDRFSAADITFASLCAPLLMTPAYGVPLPRLDELPPDFKREVTAFREHPAGRFALDLYARHRRG